MEEEYEEYEENTHKVFKSSIESNTYDMYLDGEIGPPREYIEWFNIFRSATKNDVINIYINSYGGDLSTALQMSWLITNTQAFVAAYIEGNCHSAAAIIFLHANTHYISDYSTFMIHNYSGGTFGKGGEMYSQISFEFKWAEQITNTIYEGFLSEEEITNVLKNHDIWLDSIEVIDRCTKLEKFRLAKHRTNVTTTTTSTYTDTYNGSLLKG